MCNVATDGGLSPNAVVAAWVHDVCVASDLGRYIFQHTPTQGSSRSLTGTTGPTGARRKAPALGDRDSTVKKNRPVFTSEKHPRPMPPKKKRTRGSKGEGDLTPQPPPAKRSSVAKPQNRRRRYSKEEEDNDAAQEDLTPRPRARNSTLAQTKGSAYVPALQNKAASGLGSMEPLDSSVDNSKASSKSPVKRMGDLRFARMPILYEDLSKSLEKLPSDARGLYEKLRVVSSATGVLPANIKDEISECNNEVDLLLPHMFDETSTANTRSRTQLLWELRYVKKICDATSRCSVQQEAEASWNCIVHSPILDLALEVCKGVEFRNVYGDHSHINSEFTDPTSTAAKICPAFDHRDIVGKPLQSKMVDFAINLVTDKDVDRRITELLDGQHPNLRTINQSIHHPLRFAPVFVSIETKRPGGSVQDADILLGVWASAYFKRIHKLCKNGPFQIALPLLYVYADLWFLMFACDTADGTVVLSRYLVGSTSTVLGCYKVMTAIRILSEWGTTNFKQWFESSVLQSAQESTDPQPVQE
ncbi:uncharacterized protein Z518_09713 [Rhinocladiella mackenziei CBS 650.93]|uniref:PD-(D/E)XK nuclease-like domain-containing protein n=1 Tax=Rhinocladiella mackenziei CBS 650.93 TaxID=1442369 RepID=A0A0D2GQR8_9EURO|nr:uncharacterized protein Z518_09713 [Rhinocladiella mackenziei CBS 650.93]KIX00648.1 hypothetical protein Z518_09713 [Rhinocladiella mackenziei CBS 650.93]